MPGGTQHSAMARLAVDMVPDDVRTALDPWTAKLVGSWCSLPDMWYGAGEMKAIADKYAFFTDGIPFHYIPDTPITPLYRFYDLVDGHLELAEPYANDHWRHARRGFEHYAGQVIAALVAGDRETAAGGLGWLLHMLQDYSFGAHSLEGPYGTDIFVLQRLFAGAESPDFNPWRVLAEPTPPPAVAPPTELRLLGRTPPEIALHLYRRHVQTTDAARRLCHEIVGNARAGQEARNAELFDRMYLNAAKLNAEVVLTVVRAAGQPAAPLPEYLTHVSLVDLEPVRRHWLADLPYRNYALVRDEAIGPDRHTVPLSVLGDPPAPGVRGFGIGGHLRSTLAWELPANLYTRLTGRLGLQGDLPPGTVDVTLRLAGVPAIAERLDADHPAIAVDLSDPAGIVELELLTQPGPPAHLNWLDPVLTRQ